MNGLAITIAIILLPGIFASVICDKLIVHASKWNLLKYSMYSILLGVFSYFVLQLIFWAIDLLAVFSCEKSLYFRPLETWSIIKDKDSDISLSEVFYSFILAPVVALTATAIVNHKILNLVAQSLNVSYKYGDENLFTYFLAPEEISWVYIRDKEANVSYRGRVCTFSETDKIQEIVLLDVDVYNNENSAPLYHLHKLYLSKEAGKLIIEVPNFEEVPPAES